MPNILYWTPGFLPDIGGPQILDSHFLPQMQSRGFRFLVITARKDSSHPSSSDQDGITVKRFPFFQALHDNDLPKVLAIRSEIDALWEGFSPDLVHLHIMDTMGYFFLESIKKYPVPTLLTLHASLAGFQSGDDTVLGKLVRKADWVTAVSKATLSDAKNLWPEIETNSQVINNGLAAPDGEISPLPFKSPVVLCLGRMVEEKGFDIALRALHTILTDFPDCRMIFAGDGPQREVLEELAASLRLTDQVSFHGWVPPTAVADLIDEATIVLIPSRGQEAFPLVAIQAAQRGRPVIATEVGGLPEAILRDKTGLLIPAEDCNGLIRAVKTLLGDPQKAISIGIAAQEHASTHFSLKSYLDKYTEVYSKLVA